MIVLVFSFCVLMGTLFSAYMADRDAKRFSKREEPETPPRLDWCDGCDQTKPSSVMAFTEGGLYRCATCRGEEEPVSSQKKCWEERQRREKVEKPSPILRKAVTGRNIELNSVPPGSQVIAQGGGSSITVHGDVGSHAVLVAQGGSARITIRGHIGTYAKVTAQGGSAEVKYGSADPTADITAQGGGSKVVSTGRRSV